MFTHDTLMTVTANLPMRQIDINGKPYLQRYFVGQNADGSQVWLHRFLSSDGDRYFHNHPWSADSMIIVGGYKELSLQYQNVVSEEVFKAGQRNHIAKLKLHKIVDVVPETWTMMIVYPEWEDNWQFINLKGHTINMGKRSSHRDRWWTQFGVRHDQ